MGKRKVNKVKCAVCGKAILPIHEACKPKIRLTVANVQPEDLEAASAKLREAFDLEVTVVQGESDGST